MTDNNNSSSLSGLASSIRSTLESTTYDLAGNSSSSISHTISSAFASPFTHLQQSNNDNTNNNNDAIGMIRITFIVGAGKLSRQKYDEKAMQIVTTTLKNECGYVEDRGASCIAECGGCYKTQHDTGKNLFTVVVFPKIYTAESEASNGGGASSYHDATTNNTNGNDGSSEQNNSYPIPLPLIEGTPMHSILLSSENTFQQMASSTNSASSMCPTWSEKKLCSDLLKYSLDTIAMLDAKLMTGTPLTIAEDEFYNAVGGGVDGATQKLEYIKKCMQSQVEAGKITAEEQTKLISQVQDRIDALQEEIDVALSKSQEKKAAKLALQLDKAKTRKTMIESHDVRKTYALPPLKYESEIVKLRKKLVPLLKLEQSTKGRLLTMKETRELAAKDEILQEIETLENESRGWLEEEDMFLKRVEISRGRVKMGTSGASGGNGGAKKGGAGKKPGTGSRSVAGNSTNWFTPGGLAAKQNALGKKAVAKKTGGGGGGGGVFAAMMMDSDSD